jgi:DNA-binding Lrp family transcriptional regulator
VTVTATGLRAHLLLQAEPGRAQEVADFVAAIPEVAGAETTSGPFDVIAVVDGVSEHDLSHAMARVRRAPGLHALRVCRAG